MSKKDTGDISPDDKAFARKASAIQATSVRGGGGISKYATMMDQMSETAFTRQAADVGMGFSDQGGSSRVPIMYVDPMFDPILLMFPKENLKELNRRLRLGPPPIERCLDCGPGA